MLFNVISFLGIFETVDGRRIHHLLRKTIPVIDHTITKDTFSNF